MESHNDKKTYATAGLATGKNETRIRNFVSVSDTAVPPTVTGDKNVKPGAHHTVLGRDRILQYERELVPGKYLPRQKQLPIKSKIRPTYTFSKSNNDEELARNCYSSDDDVDLRSDSVFDPLSFDRQFTSREAYYLGLDRGHDTFRTTVSQWVNRDSFAEMIRVGDPVELVISNDRPQLSAGQVYETMAYAVFDSASLLIQDNLVSAVTDVPIQSVSLRVVITLTSATIEPDTGVVDIGFFDADGAPVASVSDTLWNFSPLFTPGSSQSSYSFARYLSGAQFIWTQCVAVIGWGFSSTIFSSGTISISNLTFVGGSLAQNVRLIAGAGVDVPIWSSAHNQPVVDGEQPLRAVYFVRNEGSAHDTRWRAYTMNGVNLLVATSTTKKAAKDCLSRMISNLYNGSLPILSQVSTMDEMKARAHNKTMHTLNGNTYRSRAEAQQAHLQELMVMMKDIPVVSKVSEIGFDDNESYVLRDAQEKAQQAKMLRDEMIKMPPEELKAVLDGYLGDNTFVFRHEMGLISMVLDLEPWRFEVLDRVLADIDDILEPEPSSPMTQCNVEPIHPANTNIRGGVVIKKKEGDRAKVNRDPAMNEKPPSIAERLREEEDRKRIKQQKTDNYEAMIKRVVQKCRNEIYCPVWFKYSSTPKNMKVVVAERLWGPGWSGKHDMSSNQWVVFCVLNAVNVFTCVELLLKTVEPVHNLRARYDIDPAFEAYIGLSWVEDSERRACEAAMHNKTVHALNGNTTFSRSMEDVIRARDTFDLLDSADMTGKLAKGSELELKLATIPSDTNPSLDSVYARTVIRGSTISANNLVTNDVALTNPLTMCYPRDVRPDGISALVPSTQRLPVFNTLSLSFNMSNMEMSEYGRLIYEKQVTANTMLARPDNITQNGWSMIEMASTVKKKPVNGFCTDDLMLKLTLLHTIYSFEARANSLPFTIFNGIDQLTRADPTVQPILTWNTSPIFGEDCGGATALFPYSSISGTVAFHLSEQSVPVSQRGNIIYCPTGLINGSEQDGENLALFIRMWAPYPAHMAVVSVGTTAADGSNPGPQDFVPKASLVQVAGYAQLHVVLPRITATRTPTDQQAAQDSAIYVPSTGSTQSTNLAPNTVLNVSWVGVGGLTTYNLCEYLYTWNNDHDATTITVFLSKLQCLVGIKESLGRAQELADFYSTAVPTMPIATPITSTFFAPNTSRSFMTTDLFGQQDVYLGTNWPQIINAKANMIIHKCDPLSWNLVALNLYNTDVDSASETLLEGFGRTQSLWWTVLRASVLTAAWTSHVSALGWDQTTWNTAYTNTSMVAFREHIQGYYSNIATRGRLSNSHWGPMMAKWYKATTGYVNATFKQDQTLLTIWDYRIPNPRLYGSVVTQTTGAILDSVIPVTVCDVWLNALLESVPRYQMALPPPGGLSSATGFTDGLVYHKVAQGFVGGWVQANTIRNALSANEIIMTTSDSRWNERLLYIAGGATALYYDGTAPAGSPGIDTFATQRGVVPPVWVNQLPGTNEYSRSTIANPLYDHNGLFTHAVATAANGSIVVQAMGGKATVNIPCWQLSYVTARSDVPTDVKMISPWARFKAQPSAGKAESGEKNASPNVKGSDAKDSVRSGDIPVVATAVDLKV